MEIPPEISNGSPEPCVVLLASASANDSVAYAIRSRGWTSRTHDESLAAFADLLVVERENVSRAAWGLQAAARSHLVIVGPAPAERLEELRELCTSARRYAPRATIWVFEGDEMRCVCEGHAEEAMTPPAVNDLPVAHDLPAVNAPPAPTGRELRLTPGETIDEVSGEAARISSAELDMLFGDEGTRGIAP